MGVNRGIFVRATGTAPSKVGTTPVESRLAIAGLLACNAPGVPRQGVLAESVASTAALVSGNPSGMTYAVLPCEIVVTRAASEGAYILTISGASTSIATDPAPATGSRWDIVYVRQNDTDKGDADNTAVLGVLKGTSGTSPTRPTVPAGSYALSEARIYAGTTGTSGGANTIAALHAWTTARGGICPVLSPADRDTFTAPYPGQRITRLDREDWIQRFNASSLMWEFEGWRRGGVNDGDTLTEFGGGGTASRQIALWNSVKPYARVLNVYGRGTILCGNVSSGTEDVNLSVSAVQTQVANAQGRARMTWNAGYSTLNQSRSVQAQGILVNAGADALVRLWLEVVTGTVTITPNFGTYYHLYFDYQPQAD